MDRDIRSTPAQPQEHEPLQPDYAAVPRWDQELDEAYEHFAPPRRPRGPRLVLVHSRD